MLVKSLWLNRKKQEINCLDFLFFFYYHLTCLI